MKKCLLIICIFFQIIPILGQNRGTLVNLSLKNSNLKEFIQVIEKQTAYTFMYMNIDVYSKRDITINVKQTSIEKVLDEVLPQRGFYYEIRDNHILLTNKDLKTTPNNESSKPTKNKRRIKRFVLDEQGQPIIGASVLLKGTSAGTITKEDGSFEIDIPSESSILRISFIGYTTLESAVNKLPLNNIVLKDFSKVIDDIIVVGYSTRSREKLISSVSTIKNEDLLKSTVPNIENALSGKVSGVFSRQSSGEPGSDWGNITIRGFGSALIVVDGIAGRGFADIDPSEIESISILKDASAAAVYGMQGANGVILVTTKRGNRNKKTVFDISIRTGVQVPTRYPNVASTDLWQELVNEYNINQKLIVDHTVLATPESMQKTPYQYNTDWYQELMRPAPINQSNVNISGGSEKINYFFSGGMLSQQGIWDTNSTQKNRFNFRSNIDANIFDNLKASVSAGAIVSKTEYPGASAATIARNLKTAPNVPVHWDGRPEMYAFGGEGQNNPVALADKNVSGYANYESKSFTVDASLEYKIKQTGLSLKGVLGYSIDYGWNKFWNKNIVYLGYHYDSNEYYKSVSAANANKASLTLESSNTESLTGQFYINYIKSISNHNFNTGLIFETNQISAKSLNTSRGEFPSTILDMMAGGLANKLVSNGEYAREYRSASIIERFSYDYKSKYFVDINCRYDGAQYFAKKWGFFPSVSLGWFLTKEDFMKGVKPVLKELKFRASYGELGDLSAAKSYYTNGEQYYFQSGYIYPGNELTFGDRTLYSLIETKNANPDFTWSKSKLANVGFDFKLFNDKILSGSVEVFYRNRNGLPAQKANDNSGALATWYNLNSDNTRGFEIALNHENTIRNFTYYVNGNISWSRSKNGRLEHGQFNNGFSEWKWNGEGQWTNTRWGLNCIGHYQSFEEIANAPMHNNSNYNNVILPGDLKYEDWNGDGYIDEDDMKPIGRTAYPELMFGLTTGFNWKGFDFTAFFQGGALSNFVVSSFDMDAFQEGNTNVNTWDYFKDRWRKEDYTNPDSKWIPGHFPAIRDMFASTINRYSSTYWMFNGNYVRLKNLEVGYTLPVSITKKMNISSLRVYANGYNILTFAAQKYFDPEQAETYFSFASYPQIMSFNFGLNLKF